MTFLGRHPLRAAMLVVGTLAALGGCLAPADEDGTPEAVNPSRGDALTMSACGTVLGAFDGTNAFSNGDDTGSGYSCAGAGTYGLQYQCVELVMRHWKTHWGLSWYGNAKDLLDNAPKANVDVYANGDAAHPPAPGDMIVWENGSYGHVALVTAVHADGVDVLEQNVKGNGRATLPWDGAHIGVRWGSWTPAGWAHAKTNGEIETGGSGGGGTGGSGTGGTGTGGTGTGGTGTGGTGTGGTGTGGTGTGGTGTGGSGGSGISWNCNDSAYNGQQYWTCSGGNVYECQGGVPVEQTCSNGCQSNPLGTDDTCKSSSPPPPSWNCNNSAYNGQQYWTCSGGNVYECQGGVPVEQTCPNGCQSNPVGTDDTCKSSSPPSWSCNNSAYNGQQYWTCSGGNIYECQGGVPEEQTCANGCKSNPVGTDDVCL